jgi:hypothetical protein
VSSWEASEAEEYYSPQEELDFLSASDQEENEDYDIHRPVVNGNNGVEHQAFALNSGRADSGSPELIEANDSLFELPEGRHR